MIDSIAGVRGKVASARGSIHSPEGERLSSPVSSQATARPRRASTYLRRARPPTVLRKSAIVLGSGTGAWGFTVPTVLIAASSVVMPPDELGTSSTSLGKPSQRAGGTAELERVVGDRVDRRDHVRLRIAGERPVQDAGDRQRREVGSGDPL